jgi:hypothetical protein
VRVPSSAKTIGKPTLIADPHDFAVRHFYLLPPRIGNRGHRSGEGKSVRITINARRTSTGLDCGCTPSCPSRLSSSGTPRSSASNHQNLFPPLGAGPATGGVMDGGRGKIGGGGDVTGCRGAEAGGGGRRKTTSGGAPVPVLRLATHRQPLVVPLEYTYLSPSPEYEVCDTFGAQGSPPIVRLELPRAIRLQKVHRGRIRRMGQERQ